jgi:hypothetical protein
MTTIERLLVLSITLERHADIYAEYLDKPMNQAPRVQIWIKRLIDDLRVVVAEIDSIGEGEVEKTNCNNCVLGEEGVCSDCAGENYGHTTEISGKSWCSNWKGTM